MCCMWNGLRGMCEIGVCVCAENVVGIVQDSFGSLRKVSHTGLRGVCELG
jgi:hypothetical protein